MKEIRFHGRGGQGAVTAAELLAVAAFYDGKYCQAFPFFGVERRGAPVTAFTKIDEKPIRNRAQIYEPDYVVVQDASLLGVVNVTAGLKDSGAILINTEKGPSELEVNTETKIYTIDATKIALEVLGLPIVNTSMLGALAGATKEVTLESIKKAIKKRFPEKLAVKNIKAVEEAYRQVEE